VTVKPSEVRQLIKESGGKVTSIGALPDGSGFATASFPLPLDHWLYARKLEKIEPVFHPINEEARKDVAAKIRSAARLAIRGATRNGQEKDFDPDALVQNLIINLIGPRTLTHK